MKLKIDTPYYLENTRNPWRAQLIDKDKLGVYSIHVGIFSTWAEALLKGRIAFRFANTRIAWNSKTRIVKDGD